MALPRLLAGPILRRTEAGRVVVWLATLPAVRASGEVLRLRDGRADAGEVIARADAARVVLGENLCVQLITLVPDKRRFPGDELLAYDVQLTEQDGGGSRRLPQLGLMDAPTPLAYSGLSLPTFFVRENIGALSLVHGSCRLLHGAGEDAFLAADEAIARHAGDVARRPSAMFLTGDQIYADDVAAPMIGHIRRLATELRGEGDETSVPGMPPLAGVPVDGRRELVRERARFTSSRPKNHLMSFGEFAAMYLTAWNEAVWPAAFPSVRELDGRRARVVRRRRYELQRRYLEAARRALPSVRRVLANTPTYMGFDDHDTTDDWNLTRAWRDAVYDSRSGRRIVANALASFWAFQGWGNDPDLFDGTFISTVSGFLSGDGTSGGDAFDSLMWSFDRWSYVAPTDPPAIVLDTRTQRGYDSPHGGARLLGPAARRRVVELAKQSGHRRGGRIIVVSAVPVFGFELQERRQKNLLDKLGPYEIDFEAWHSNLRGLVDLMKTLVEDIGSSSCILLSGDVHYGVNARASFVIENESVLLTQLVSSGQKHASVAAKTMLNSFGRLLHTKHERLGWHTPPRCKRRGPLADLFMRRAVNRDEWTDASPVFLAPRDVKLLGIDQPPDYRECRIYVRPRGRNSSILVGENNVGFVSLEGNRVTHRLLARGRLGTRAHVAEMNVEEEPG
jgi:hypothetical protein